MKKYADISEISWVLLLKAIFSKTKLNYTRTKFQVSRIIITNFRQRVILPPLTSKQIPKEPTQIRVNPFIDNIENWSSIP